MSTNLYVTKPVPLHEVKPGSLVEHDGKVYRVFRFVPVVKPGGWVAMAVERDWLGQYDGESVALLYANHKSVVLLVSGAVVPQ